MFQFKFSIITVVKNDEINLEKTIKSIIKQRELNDVEYIVIDGKSNDRTIEIINKYKKHINKFVSEPDKGIYDAMNKGINLSTGDIIGICNSGDTLLPNGLSYISNQFKQNYDFSEENVSWACLMDDTPTITLSIFFKDLIYSIDVSRSKNPPARIFIATSFPEYFSKYVSHSWREGFIKKPDLLKEVII